MKTSTMLLPVSLLFVLSAGCGKSAQKAAEKAVENTVKDTGEKLKCAVADSFAPFSQSLANDYDVKLYRETILKVMDDIRGKNLKAEQFWGSLSSEVRDTLNYELNLYMAKLRPKDALAVYQSAAYFFTGVKDQFDETNEYKVRDKAGMVYSFKIRAVEVKQVQLFNFVCGRHERTDLSSIVIGKEVQQLSEVKEIYECRSQAKSLILMEMPEKLYLMAGKSLYRLASSQLVKKDKNRRFEMSLETNEVKFKIKINKKREQEVEDWNGRRSEIEIIAPDYAMDEKAGCNTFIHSLAGE